MDEHIREATDEVLVGALRADAVVVAELQARQLACVGELVRREREDPLRRGEGELRFDRLVPLVTAHVVCALGLSRSRAEAMVVLADHLTRVLPETLGAVADFRLDVERARVLSEATCGLDDAAARRVQKLVLGGLRVPPREVRAAAADVVDPSDPVQAAEADLPVRPWRSCSARTWRDRVARQVVGADPDHARRRREQGVRDRCVRTGPCVDGMGSLWGRLPAEDTVAVEDGITALADAWPRTDPAGHKLDVEQRRADAFVDLFRRVLAGDTLPTVSTDARRSAARGVGIVLHADTFFGDGPRQHAAGEHRGLGRPVPVDPATARELATCSLAKGAATTVLLADSAGRLERLVQLGTGSWTDRAGLERAVREAVTTAPPLATDGYEPTAVIAAHVRAARPRRSFPDCPRAARRCDLDHDVAWPRGATCACNLDPKCRRHHVMKTRGDFRTRRHTDGSTTWTSRRGTITITTSPPPLPGYAPGETGRSSAAAA